MTTDYKNDFKQARVASIIAALEAEIAEHDKMYPIIKKQIDDTATENAKLRALLENCVAILRNVEFIDTGGVVAQARTILEAK